jgi:hypothetical protein
MAPELKPYFEKMISERTRGAIDFEELATEYEDAGSLMMPPNESKEHEHHRLTELKMAHANDGKSGPMGDFKETKGEVYVADEAQRAIGAALTAAAAAAAAATSSTSMSMTSAPLAISSSEVHLEIVSSSQPLMALSTPGSDSTNF